MKSKLRNLLLILLIGSFSLPLFGSTGQENATSQFELANKLFKKGAESFDIATLSRSRQLFLELFNTSSHDYVTAYKIAHADSKLVEIYLNQSNKDKTSFYIEDALKYIKESIAMNDKFSDAFCLLAGVLAQKIQLTGITGGILYLKKTSEALRRAMEIDPNNPDVYVGFGITYIATPLLFGGDLDKGIDFLNKALQIAPNRCRAYVWLGKAYRRKGQVDKAKSMLLKALAYNPNDLGAIKELTHLTN